MKPNLNDLKNNAEFKNKQSTKRCLEYDNICINVTIETK